MTAITIDIPDPQAAVLAEKAKVQGLTLEDWFRKVADKEAAPSAAAHLQKTNPEEWRRRFEEFLASRDPNTPVLSDEAMSRDSSYPDRS